MKYTSEQVAFNIISKAGDASSMFLKAFNEAKNSNFDKARELVTEGNKTLKEAHEIQTKLITSEAKGEKIEIGILMVHAQDHLMNTMLIKELTAHIISLYEQISSLK